MQDITALKAEREQLLARIAEIDALIAADAQAPSSTYTIIEKTTENGTLYTVKRTDGAEDDRRIADATYRRREDAEVHAEFCERTPDYYRIRRGVHSGRRIGEHGPYWKISSVNNDDPHTFDRMINGEPSAETLVRQALTDDAGLQARITAKAEADATAAAEAIVREARAAQIAQAQREKGPLATPRQVEYILTLLQQREITGEGGGFYYGPTDRAGIETMSKAEASIYIESLKGNY